MQLLRLDKSLTSRFMSEMKAGSTVVTKIVGQGKGWCCYSLDWTTWFLHIIWLDLVILAM